MNMQEAIHAVLDRRDLSADEMTEVMRIIMTGAATPAQIGGFLIGLRMKSESVDEITAAAAVMRALATRVQVQGPHLVDTCGTGGDGASTFNISTAAALTAAAAGAKVAKHGNRSVSSSSGSADVLMAAGVNLDLDPETVGRCIDAIGVGFLFAPKHHGAMKHAIGPRKEMGARTIFNILGPLTNPAAAPNQVLGVFNAALTAPLAQVLQKLGSEHVMVVNADDGLDEISIGAATRVSELRNGVITHYSIEPEQFDLERRDVAALSVDGPEASLAMLREALSDEPGPARDIVALNAGAAIYVSGVAASLPAGVGLAFETLANGGGLRKLEQLIAFTNA